MEKLPLYIIQDILYFLDIKSTKQCKFVSKKFNSLINQNYFWKLKFNKSSPSSYFSTQYFKFPDLSSLCDKIHSRNQEIESFADVYNFWKKISDPQKLEIKSIEASSEDNDQVATCLLTYDQSFWSSLPNDSNDTDEYLILELKEPSLIFAVNFYVYRAIYQGGTIYPPKFAKIYIGDTKDSFSYESEQYPIGITENCNTILLLPELIKGTFIKLQLIGKQMREFGSEKWYTVLRYIEVLGQNSNIDPNLEFCKKGIFEPESVQLNIISPFYMERLEKFGHIKNYLDTVTLSANDITSYFSYIYCGVSYGFSEILGNYLLEKGEYLHAKKIFMRIGDVWGCCKVCLRLKEFDQIKNLIGENNPREPTRAWVLNIAELLGGKELKDELEIFLNSQ